MLLARGGAPRWLVGGGHKHHMPPRPFLRMVERVPKSQREWGPAWDWGPHVGRGHACAVDEGGARGALRWLRPSQ